MYEYMVVCVDVEDWRGRSEVEERNRVEDARQDQAVGESSGLS